MYFYIKKCCCCNIDTTYVLGFVQVAVEDLDLSSIFPIDITDAVNIL